MPDAPFSIRGRLLAAAVGGLLLGLTMPTVGFAVLLPVALVPLMAAVEGSAPVAAALVGGTFGATFWLTTIPWVAYTVHHFGEFPWVVSGLAVLIASFILALPFGAMAWLVALAGPVAPWGTAATWVAAWVLQETIRIHFLGGLPWALLAHPLVAVPELVQTAALGGALLPGALVVLLDALLFAAFRAGNARQRAGFAALGALLAASVWLFGAARLRSLEAAPGPVLPPLRVTLIQPNVAQTLRFTLEAREAIYQNLMAQTRAVARRDRPDLILWPESAVPWDWQTSTRIQKETFDLCREERTSLLLNTVWSDRPEDDDAPYYNAALLVTASGPVLPPYEKQRLVPFGEYVPLGALLRSIRPISRAVPGSFSPGNGGEPIPIGPWRLGGAVCYEVIYPWIARGHVLRGANVLFTLTNDAWYGTLGAREQHWQGAALRSVETGVPLLRAAITGITGWVDPGGVRHTIPVDVEGSLTVTLGGATGRARPLFPPPAVEVGDLLAAVCAAGAGIGILRRRVFQPRKTAGTTL